MKLFVIVCTDWFVIGNVCPRFRLSFRLCLEDRKVLTSGLWDAVNVERCECCFAERLRRVYSKYGLHCRVFFTVCTFICVITYHFWKYMFVYVLMCFKQSCHVPVQIWRTVTAEAYTVFPCGEWQAHLLLSCSFRIKPITLMDWLQPGSPLHKLLRADWLCCICT